MADTKVLLVFFLVASLLLAACGKSEDGVTLKELQENTSAQDALVDEGEEAAPDAPEEEAAPEDDVLVEPLPDERLIEENVTAAPVIEERLSALAPATVLSQETTIGTPDASEKTEDAAIFGDLRCEIRGPANTRGIGGSDYPDDLVEFTLQNRDSREYYLGYYRKGLNSSLLPKDSLKIEINNRKIDNLEEACGTLILAPGATVECRNIHTTILSGETIYGKPMRNLLEADGVYMRSKIVFSCSFS